MLLLVNFSFPMFARLLSNMKQIFFSAITYMKIVTYLDHEETMTICICILQHDFRLQTSFLNIMHVWNKNPDTHAHEVEIFKDKEWNYMFFIG